MSIAIPTQPSASSPSKSPTSLAGRIHGALDYDYCPWANKWVYWLKHPFWLLVIAAITAIFCGIYVSPAVLLMGVSLAVLLVMGIAWPWLAVRGLTAKLRFRQTRSREGEPIEVEVEVTNAWPWPVWGLKLSRGFQLVSIERGAGWDGSFEHGLTVTGVRGWATEAIDAVFKPTVRGVYPLVTPSIETSFPFGLYSARKTLSDWNTLVVWPGKTALKTLPDAVEIASREDRTSDKRAGDVGDVLGTRWFRQGDSLRRVHWAQSARQGRLIVVERQQPISCALRLVLDLDPKHHGGEGREASIERLLRTAASIIESMHAQHATIECVIGHETIMVNSSASDLRRCLDQLAKVPAKGIHVCAQHGLCCSPGHRHRAMSEYLLTTQRGFSNLMHGEHWSSNHHLIVVGSESTPIPASCHDHVHCACKPWLELDPKEDVLAQLPRQWERACRVA